MSKSEDEPRWLSVKELSYHGGGVMGRRPNKESRVTDQGKFIQWVEETVPEGNWQATKLAGYLRSGPDGISYLGLMAEEYIQHTLGARDLDADVAAAKERIAAFLMQERP